MNENAPSAGQLDAEELLYLALRAMEHDRDEHAISYLKRGLVLEPKSGLLHHLLGAMYAQLGMIDRAVEEMTHAITFEPQLHMARFQLGLLYFTATDIAAAERVWQPLSELPSDSALYLFRSGLLHLGRDELPQCVAELRLGIGRNVDHPSLNHDMQMLADMAEEALGATDAPAQDREAPASAGRHVLLSGYQGLDADKKIN